jgi:hypothetical protein
MTPSRNDRLYSPMRELAGWMSSQTHGLAFEAELAIQHLVTDYWLRVDARDPQPAEDLFTTDASFQLGSLSLQGREALRAFFSKRLADFAASKRTTRHFCANFRAIAVGTHQVRVSTTAMQMAGNGPLPLASSLPSVVDFDDLCTFDEGFGWRFQSRVATSVFLGPEAPTFARSAPLAPR